MRHIKVLGIDLAKSVFQIHGLDAKGKCVLRKKLSRTQLIEFMSKLPACLVGMESCGGAHFWARKFKALGHDVRLIAPQFVKPFVKSNKNDRNDAEAIAEAVSRPSMRFVPIKEIEQQDIQMLHRTREFIVKTRTAQGNQLRGLLAEYGIILPKGISHIRRLMPEILENKVGELTELALAEFKQLYEQFKTYDERVKDSDRKLELLAHHDPRCQQLMKIEGVGPLIATAAVAALGNAKEFKKGREVSAWLGLVPRQSSSGGKECLLGISKRGDRYLRTLLIHGARSIVNICERKTDPRSMWLADKKLRCGANKAAVALANKNARIIWALLATGECYRKQAA